MSNIPRANAKEDLQWHEDYMFWKPPSTIGDIIQPGILKPENRMMLVGEAKAWKTNTSLYTGYVLSQGLPWFGYQTTQSAVLMYQVELPKPTHHERVVLFDSKLESRPPRKRIAYKTSTGLKLDTTYGLSSLSADVVRVQKEMDAEHLVLILDPVYRLMSGHISDPRDVDRFQTNVDEVRDKFKISIIAVHHTRLTQYDSQGNEIEAGPQATMGSSYFNDWCDTMVMMKVLNPLYKGGSADEVRIDWGYARNAPRPLSGFTIKWSRSSLFPTVVEKDFGQSELKESVSVRDLQG